jgi:hypothetical protein
MTGNFVPVAGPEQARLCSTLSLSGSAGASPGQRGVGADLLGSVGAQGLGRVRSA